MKRTHTLQTIGLYVIGINASCILLSAPEAISLLLSTLCLLGAGIAWIIAYSLRTQVAISMGRKHIQHRALMIESNKLLLGLLLLSTFYVVFLHYKFLFEWPVTLLMTCFLLLAARYYLERFLYARSLTTSELRTFTHEQWQQLGWDFLAWSIVIGSEAFLAWIMLPDLHSLSLHSLSVHFIYMNQYMDQSQWHQDAALALALLWLLANVLKGVEALYQQLLLVRRKI